MLSFLLTFNQPSMVKFKEVSPQNFFPDVNYTGPVFLVLQPPLVTVPGCLSASLNIHDSPLKCIS